MNTAELKHIAIEHLHAHPDNPRLVIRQDVVDGIAANLNGAFPEKHAIHVRPIADGYQVLSGHHRLAAAKLRGMKTIPAWVEDMEDSAAFMELVLSNNQGELSPLEIGMHALRAVPKAEGGRGKKGGLSEYAGKIGKLKQNVGTYRKAATVLTGLLEENRNIDVTVYFDKAQHLAVIADLPEWMHETAGAFCVKDKWSVADTKHWVSKLAEFEFSKRWAFFLDPVAVITRFLETKEFSPRTVAAIESHAEATAQMIRGVEVFSGIDVLPYEEAFTQWLKENEGKDSWDVRKIEAYRRTLGAELDALREAKEAAAVADAVVVAASWQHGDWREFFPAMEDGSVSLLLTDPPYGIGYQSDYRLDRQKGRKNVPIEGDQSTDAIKEMAVAVFPKLKADAHVLIFCHWKNEQEVRDLLTAAGLLVRGSLIWVKNNTGMGDPKTTFAPQHERILHAVKGSPILFERQSDVLTFDRCNSDRHPTEKPVPLLKRLIEVTTVSGELVIDPFGGVASTLVAAREMGRKYWGCEINEGYFKAGSERIAETAP